MPKILRKDIYVTSMISLIACSFICMINGFRISNSVTIEIIFNGVNLFGWMLTGSTVFKGLFKISLADYMFIAPYSLEQRKSLVKKVISYKFIIVFSCIELFIVCPLLVFAISQKNILQIIICIIESVILYTMIYSGLYLDYMSKVDYGKYFLVGAIRIFQLCMYVGSCMFEDKIIDSVILVVVVLAGIFVIVFCRRNYYDAMIGYLSDYERSREIKLNKK